MSSEQRTTSKATPVLARSRRQKCGSPRQNGRPPCNMPAGSRTGHPGTGRCWLHGGNARIGPEHGGWRHGLYAKVFRGQLAERFKQTAGGEDPLQLYGELAAARALVTDYIDRLENQDSLSKDDITIVLAWLSQIGTLAGRIVDARASMALTRAEILYIQAQMESAIRDFTPDAERQRAFVDRIRRAIPGRLELEPEGPETPGAGSGETLGDPLALPGTPHAGSEVRADAAAGGMPSADNDQGE